MDDEILWLIDQSDTASLDHLEAELNASRDPIFFRCFKLSLDDLVEMVTFELTDNGAYFEYSLTDKGEQYLQDISRGTEEESEDPESEFTWVDCK